MLNLTSLTSIAYTQDAARVYPVRSVQNANPFTYEVEQGKESSSDFSSSEYSSYGESYESTDLTGIQISAEMQEFLASLEQEESESFDSLTDEDTQNTSQSDTEQSTNPDANDLNATPLYSAAASVNIQNTQANVQDSLASVSAQNTQSSAQNTNSATQLQSAVQPIEGQQSANTTANQDFSSSESKQNNTTQSSAKEMNLMARAISAYSKYQTR